MDKAAEVREQPPSYESATTSFASPPPLQVYPEPPEYSRDGNISEPCVPATIVPPYRQGCNVYELFEK